MAVRSASGVPSCCSGCEDGAGVGGRSDVDAGDHDDRCAVQFGGDVGQRGDAPQADLGGERVGGPASGVTPRPQHRRRVLVRVQDERGGHVGAEGVEIELQGGDHAETAAAAADGPEQVGVLVAAGGADHAVGGDDLDRAQVVAAEAVGAHHHAESAAEGEAGDAGDRHLSAGGGQPVDLGGPVDLAPGGAGLHAGGSGGGVDVDGPHRGEVDDQAVVADGAAGHLVAATADGRDGAMVPCDSYGLDDVGHVGAARDDGGVAVDQPVPDPTGLVVGGVITVDDLAAERRAQRVAHRPFGVRCQWGCGGGVCHAARVARGPCTALERRCHARMNAVSAAGIATKAVTPAVRVEMLGPLRLFVGDEVVDVPGPKRRAVLALLAAAEGRAVATADVLDALWPVGVPDSARATLQSHVSRLRGHLGPAAVLLEGLSGAYRLRLDAAGSGTDVARARALLATATGADPADACRLLGEARSLWRGVALAEFDDVGPLAALAVTLHALRDSVERAYATAAIDAGAADEAVEVASTLVAADPLSEAAVLILMRALDAAGRAADALRAGHDHRHRLLTETGLEPSPALNELERTIAGRTRMRPTSLPRAASGLRGRDAELAAVQRLLTHQRLVTVLGAGGVGKTALAAEIAARADHVTVVPLAPVTDPAAIPQALAAALDLHVVHGDVLSACAALLGAGPQLLVLDNCEHLLPGVRDLVATLARRLSTADDDGHQSGAARTPRRTAGATRAAGGDQPR